MLSLRSPDRSLSNVNLSRSIRIFFRMEEKVLQEGRVGMSRGALITLEISIGCWNEA